MQPLSGLLVLDFTTLLPGPLATLLLAEAGAEVIKIERPGGEDMRHYEPRFDGESAMFALLNRGKKSLVLDLKSDADRDEADAADRARRRAGRAVPAGRDGAAGARLRGACARSIRGWSIARSPATARSGPRAERGRPRSQLHRQHRTAGAQSRPARPAGGAAGADRRHRRRHAAGGDQHPARAAPARPRPGRAATSTSP